MPFWSVSGGRSCFDREVDVHEPPPKHVPEPHRIPFCLLGEAITDPRDFIETWTKARCRRARYYDRILVPNYDLKQTLILFADYTFHAYGRTEGVCGIIISDHQVSRIFTWVGLGADISLPLLWSCRNKTRNSQIISKFLDNRKISNPACVLVPSTGSSPAPIQGHGRVPLGSSALGLGQRSTSNDARAEGLPGEIPGPSPG